MEKEDETPTLFRAASLTTTLMDLYMKSVCTSFLKAALRDTIVKLIESKQSCELNPTKMDSPEDACSNAEFLLQVCNNVVLLASIDAVDIDNDQYNNIKCRATLPRF